MPGGAVTVPSAGTSIRQASVGLFGKLPVRGDFIREGLPREFVEPWDAWWQRGFGELQRHEDWRDAWMEAPVWQFALSPGMCGGLGVVGLWLPSIDKAGRCFPMTIAATAPYEWAPHVAAMSGFLDAAEQAGREALEYDLEPADLLRRIQEAFVVPVEPEPEPGAGSVVQALWWTEGGPRVAARNERGDALPEGGHFAAFVDDAWTQGGVASDRADAVALEQPS